MSATARARSRRTLHDSSTHSNHHPPSCRSTTNNPSSVCSPPAGRPSDPRITRRGPFRRRNAGLVRDRRQSLPDRAAGRGRAQNRSGRRHHRLDRRGRARADRSARRRHQPLRADHRPGDRHRLLQVPEPDRHRRPRCDDGAGRAGRRARPAQCTPEAARADVRAGRLDQRPGHDRRDDRQQFGRGSLAPLRQDRRSCARARGRSGRRHDGHPGPGAAGRARKHLLTRRFDRCDSSPGPRHGGPARSRRSAIDSPGSCAG